MSNVFDKNNVKEEPEVEFKAIPTAELDKQVQRQMKEFGSLLDSLDKNLDKKKTLWKQIYENAVIDRKNAYLVFADLYVQVHGRAAEHAIHGPTLSKYMERMGKCTDQLLKLAELVASAEEKLPEAAEDNPTDEDVYTAIQSSKAKH